MSDPPSLGLGPLSRVRLDEMLDRVGEVVAIAPGPGGGGTLITWRIRDFRP